MADSANQDEYNQKLTELQAYVPFLEKTIGYLKKTKQKSREVQLAKMESLYSMITDKNKKWKYSILIRCEEVLDKLQGRMKLDISSGSSQQKSEGNDKEGVATKDAREKEFDSKSIENIPTHEEMESANENSSQYEYEIDKNEISNNFRKDYFDRSNKESGNSENLKENYEDATNVANDSVRGRPNEFPARRPFKNKFPRGRRHRRPFAKVSKQKAMLPFLLDAMRGNSSNFHFHNDQVDYERFPRHSPHQMDDFNRNETSYDHYNDNSRPGCSRFSPPDLASNQNYSAYREREEWLEDLERLNFFNCNEERQFCDAEDDVRRGNDRRPDQNFSRFDQQYQNHRKFFRNAATPKSYKKYNFEGAFGNRNVGTYRSYDNNCDVDAGNSPRCDDRFEIETNEDFREIERVEGPGSKGENPKDEECGRIEQKKETAGNTKSEAGKKSNENGDCKFSKQNKGKEVSEDELTQTTAKENVARTKYDKIYSNIGSSFRPSVQSLYFENTTRKNFKIPKKRNPVSTKKQEIQENVSLSEKPSDEDLTKMKTYSKNGKCDSGQTGNQLTKNKKKFKRTIKNTDDKEGERKVIDREQQERIKKEEFIKNKSSEKQKLLAKDTEPESDKESVLKRKKSISNEEKQKKLKLDEKTTQKVVSLSLKSDDTKKTLSKENKTPDLTPSTIVKDANKSNGTKKDDVEKRERDDGKQEAKQVILSEATKNNLHESNSADVLEFILKNYKHIKRIFESDSSSEEEGKIKKRKKKKKKRYSSSSSDDEDLKSKKRKGEKADCKEDKAHYKEDKAKNKSPTQAQVVDDPKITSTKKETVKKRASSEQKPRKNELDFLHQDINEMWMCRDIINATGKRSCTVTKESMSTKPKNEMDFKVLIENASRLRVMVERADFSHLFEEKEAKEVPPSPTTRIVKKPKERETNVRPTKNTVAKDIAPNQHHDKNYFILSKRTDCKLCSYNGKFITFHYKTKHPGHEVLISRIDPLITERLIEDSKRNDYESMVLPGDTKEKHTYICAFCPSNMIVDYTCHFYNHITTHTGEYRYFCGECDYSSSTSQSLNAHLSKHDNKIRIKPKPAPPNSSYVFGYVCGECHYVQTLRDNITKHVQLYHDNKSEVFRINLNILMLDSGNKDAGDDVDESEKNDITINNFLKVKIEEQDQVVQDLETDVDDQTEDLVVTIPDDPEDFSRISTETNLTAFICEIDIEDKRIEKKRLEKMKEILENVNVPRASIADKLKSKLGTCDTGMTKRFLGKGAIMIRYDKSWESDKILQQKAKPSRAFVVDPNVPEKPSTIVSESSSKQPQILNITRPLNISPCLPEITNIDVPAKQKVSQLDDDELTLKKATTTQKKSVPISNIINRLQDNLNPTSTSPKDIRPSQGENSSQNLDFVETTPKLNPVGNTMPALIDCREGKPKGIVQIPVKTYQPSTKKSPVKKKNNNLPLSIDITQDDASTSSNVNVSYETNDGVLPPLSHYKTLATKEKPEVIFHAGPIKILKRKNGTILYACFVTHCVFCTDKPAVFEAHCKLTHSNAVYSVWHCSGCNMKFTQKGISPTLHEIYLHLQEMHLRYFKKNVNLELARKADVSKTSTLTVQSEDVIENTGQTQDQQDSNLILQNNTDSKYQFVITSVKSLSKESQSSEASSSRSPHIPSTVTEMVLPDVPSSKFEGLIRESTFQSSDDPSPSSSVNLQQPSSSQSEKPPGTIRKDYIRPVPISKLMASEDTEYDNTNSCNVSSKGTPGVIDVETFGQNLSPNFSYPKRLLTMDPAKIAHFYKCPIHYCKFSSFGRGEFTEHLATHPDGIIFCLYCTNMLNISSYTAHLETVHANCRYACSHCFYRATNATFVKAHIDMNHRDVNKVMIVATPTETLPRKTVDSEQFLSVRSIVKPYVCGEPNCKMETLFSNLFLEHYYVIHSRYKNMVCGYCNENLSKGILPHYWARHEIYPFHCRYCLSGSENLRTVIEHQATYHCHLPFCLISRKLRLTAKKKLTETTDEYDKIVYLYEKSVTPKYKNSNTKIIERYVMNFTENDITDKLIDIINSQPQTSSTEIEVVNVDERVIVTEIGAAPTQNESDPLSLNDAETASRMLDIDEDPFDNILKTRRMGKRFSCSLCNCKYAIKTSAEEHMRKVHNIAETTFVPTQPLNASNLEDCELTIVSKEPKQDSNFNQSSDGTVYPFCKICGILRTKGKCNHLEVVDKEYRSGNQLITAKVVTSHVICNEGTKTLKKYKIIADAIIIPQFIISGTKHTKSRYMCGGDKCQKFCRDEDTFKSHLLKAHFQQSNYICYHCGLDISFEPQTINVDLIIQHFQLHGPHLYGCSYCYFLDYSKEIITQHTVEMHPTLPVRIKVYRKSGTNVTEKVEKSKPPSPLPQVRKAGVTYNVLNKLLPPDASKSTCNESTSNEEHSAEELTISDGPSNPENDSDNIEKSKLSTQTPQVRNLAKRCYSVRKKAVRTGSSKSEKSTNAIEYSPETSTDAGVPDNYGEESDKSIEKSRSPSPLLQISKTVVTYGNLNKSPSTDFMKSTNEIASNIDNTDQSVDAIFHSEGESNSRIDEENFEINDDSQLFSQCKNSEGTDDVEKSSILKDILSISESKISVDSSSTVKEVVRTYPAPKEKLKNADFLDMFLKLSETETIVIDDNNGARENKQSKDICDPESQPSLCGSSEAEAEYSKRGFILPEGPNAQPSLDRYKCPHCYCAISSAAEFFHHLEKNEKFLKEKFLDTTASHRLVNQWIYSIIIYQTKILNFWRDTNTDVEQLCRFCPFAFYKASRKHEDRHFGEKPFTCCYCKYSCTCKRAMDVHVKSRHKDKSLLYRSNNAKAYPMKPIMKLNLGEVFLMDIMTESDFEHIEEAPITNEKPKANTCFFCDFVGGYTEHCDHYSKKHPNKEVLGFIFKCEKCSDTLFETKQLFLTHNDSCHGGTAKMIVNFTGIYNYRCEMCDQIISDKRLYKLHVTSHFKMYKCKYCGYSTSTLRCLRKHYSDYHDEKVFEYFYDFIAEYKLNNALHG